MNTYFGLFGIIFFALGFLLHSKEKKGILIEEILPA